MSDKLTNEPLNTEANIPVIDPAQKPSPSITYAEDTKPSKPKNKKKKKKQGNKNRAKTVFYDPSGQPLSVPNLSPAEPLTTENSTPVEDHTEVPQTILTLPIQPDEWFIQPATYDEDNNLLTEETFTYLKDGTEVISIPLNHDNFSGLFQLLSDRFASDREDTTADFFHVRKPLTDKEESDPVMTLTQRNRILATTSLDQKTLKRLINALQKHLEKPTTVTTWLKRWWRKHKVWRVIFVITSLPVALILLYTVVWGATH